MNAAGFTTSLAQKIRWPSRAGILGLAGALLLMACGCGRSADQVDERTPEPPPAPIVRAKQLKPLPEETAESSGTGGASFAEVSTNVTAGPAAGIPAVTNAPPELASASTDSARPQTAPSRTGFKKRSEEVNALFEKPSLFRLQIEIPRAGLSVLRRGGWGNGQRRPETRVIVREDGVVYTNVALHLKGAAGSFRPIDDKPAMTLNFDKYAPGQRFHGLDKLSLNNSVQDSSYLCEKIARELFIEAGVPVPRASHALVTLNGRDLGLYVLLEGANKQFLKHYFTNAKGNLFDGGFCQDISTSLAVNSGDNPKDRSGLRALTETVRQGRPTMAELEQVLDVDRFISMMVLETYLGHWDGYTQNRNNWRVFHDLDAHRMVFVPHGLDQLFGGGGRGFNNGGGLLPQNISGDVSRAVLATREGPRRYKQRAGEIYTNVFNPERISARVDEITSGLSAQLSETHPQLAATMRRKGTWMKTVVKNRANSLARAFGPPPKAVDFATDGLYRLTGWQPSVVRAGEPVLTPGKDEAGAFLLKIEAGSGGTSSSSWRTRARLAPGHYVFAGKVRLNGVEVEQGDTRGGVHLRVSKGPQGKHLLGSSGWQTYVYEFVVEEEAMDVEFICELRALKGEVWFDAGSLRVTQKPE